MWRVFKPCFLSCVWLCTSKCGKKCLLESNTVFNFPTDTIILSYNLNSSIHIKVPMIRSGITWWTDKYVKFQNPSFQNLSSAFAGKIHTLAQYSPLFIETLVLMCGGMFMIPPCLLLCWLAFGYNISYLWAPPSHIFQKHEMIGTPVPSSLPLGKGNVLRNLFLHL